MGRREINAEIFQDAIEHAVFHTARVYLMRILLEDTDQDHILNAEQLCRKVESRYSLTCNLKTIYSDIERLKK